MEEWNDGIGGGGKLVRNRKPKVGNKGNPIFQYSNIP
jgi:hypothetical protein